MSEMPRTESFQQATKIATEIPVIQAPVRLAPRGKLRRIALVLALLAGTAPRLLDHGPVSRIHR